MFCYGGKPVKVWPDNDGGLWFYDENRRAQTVREGKDEQKVSGGRSDPLQDMGKPKAWCVQIIEQWLWGNSGGI